MTAVNGYFITWRLSTERRFVKSDEGGTHDGGREVKVVIFRDIGKDGNMAI